MGPLPRYSRYSSTYGCWRLEIHLDILIPSARIDAAAFWPGYFRHAVRQKWFAVSRCLIRAGTHLNTAHSVFNSGIDQSAFQHGRCWASIIIYNQTRFTMKLDEIKIWPWYNSRISKSDYGLLNVSYTHENAFLLIITIRRSYKEKTYSSIER
jgi:hypothetical protein